jgi:hypothetical protein
MGNEWWLVMNLVNEQGKHQLKAWFVELRARGLSYAKIAKSLKVADGD